MAFVQSDGSIRAIDRPRPQAPYAVRLSDNLTQDYATIYRQQQSVRTVVDFLARNVSQLSLHSFRRISETDRERLRDHPLAQLIARPNGFTTTSRLFRSLVSDRGIYDCAFWLKIQEKGTMTLRRLPPNRVTIAGDDNWLAPEAFHVKGSRGTAKIKADQVVYFHGYNPVDDRLGLSPIETLRRMLAEEYAAGTMREQILRNGARASGYIERPVGGSWSDKAFNRFRDNWQAQYSGDGPLAGGTPILEDGMVFKSASQTAEELQYIEARKLTRTEVASAYHIPPPMIGILDNATFSNIEEQHKMLYQDTLGPILTDIEQEIELQLLPEFGDTNGVYVEFNLAEKLKGSFEDQATTLQTSVGGPYMSRNEARARLNLPSIEGADELIIPLNVIIGGQASPTDSAPKGFLSEAELRHVMAIAKRKTQAGTLIKSRTTDEDKTEFEKVLVKHFTRQADVVRSRIGAKADADWWDEDRWNDELAADLYALALKTSERTGKATLERVDQEPSAYDVGKTLHYMEALAANTAGRINSVTKAQIDEARAADGAEADIQHVFDVAKEARAPQSAASIATGIVGFAAVEALTQIGKQDVATKTWVVTSQHPRLSHAAMNGETVTLDENFSNGAKWPGDIILGVDEIAGCLCGVDIYMP